MRRWPPAIWLSVALGSLLIIIGVGGTWQPEAFFAGLAVLIAAFAVSLYLAFRRRTSRDRGIAWLVPATAAFYLLVAAAAALAGREYVLAAVAAALIPVTAAALIVATARSKTSDRSGSPRDRTVDDSDDPLPGVGMDDATPLGDTSEHSDTQRVATADRPGRRPRAGGPPAG